MIPAHQADGHEEVAVRYGLDSYEKNHTTKKRTLNRVGSPVILVGHSYGSATITGAGVDDRVDSLVWLRPEAPNSSAAICRKSATE